MTTQYEYKQAFREFLGIIGVRNNYAVNAANATGIAWVQANRKPEDWLVSSFSFHTTYEGLDFWLEIDDTWRDWCETMRTQNRME